MRPGRDVMHKAVCGGAIKRNASVARQINSCTGSGRHYNVVFKYAVIQLPFGYQLSITRIEDGACESQISAWLWRKDRMLVSRHSAVYVDARDRFIHPVTNCAIGIVIEGIHLGRLKAVFLGP